MHYFALLMGPESTDEPDAATQAEIMQAYQDFHTKFGKAIRAGDALAGTATGARITGGPDAPVVTDGPFAEAAEVAGGYYVIEAEDLDEALTVAAAIPACRNGAVEVWPIAEYFPPNRPVGTSWLALLFEPPANAPAPGTPEWDAGIREHQKFGAAAGDRTNGGAPLHPPATATTVRVRDGEVLLTDGPYVEGAEVANGYYILDVAGRDDAIQLGSMIPSTTVEVRQLMGLSGL